MKTTRTGEFPIGFRRAWSEWQKDLEGLVSWAKANDFAFIDLGNTADALAREVTEFGLPIGSVDLPSWQSLLASDSAKRSEAVGEAIAYIEKVCAVTGPMRFFVVMMSDDPERPAKERFANMVDAFGRLAPALEKAESQVVIEGYPGRKSLCCTPETVRAFFKEVPSPSMGYNYDPSHLVRLGIDPLRFLEEFADRIHHVHGKDTWLYHEERYEYGIEQRSMAGKSHQFGGELWRYTLPGRGVCDWTAIFKTLQAANYQGRVSIELEDEEFNGTKEGEQRGLLESRDFLAET